MKKSEKDNIAANIKWFRKFSWLRRLEIAYQEAKGVKVLRNLTSKKRCQN